MTKKLILIGQGYTEVREYKLDEDKPRTDKKDGVQFNPGFKRWPFWKYDVKNVLLKQSDKNKYKAADSPISADAYYLVEVLKSHENNGSLIVDEGKLSELMGKTDDELVTEIERLNGEIKRLRLQHIEKLKDAAKDLETIEDAFVDHAAAYYVSATTNITDLSKRIAGNITMDEEDLKKQQKELMKQERERAYKKQPPPQLPETISPTETQTESETETTEDEETNG